MTPKLIETVVRTALPDDEEVLSSPGDGAKAIILNSTGGAIADLCDGTRTIAEIAGFIVDLVSGAELACVLRDVEQLVQELEAVGLLEQT